MLIFYTSRSTHKRVQLLMIMYNNLGKLNLGIKSGSRHTIGSRCMDGRRRTQKSRKIVPRAPSNDNDAKVAGSFCMEGARRKSRKSLRKTLLRLPMKDVDDNVAPDAENNVAEDAGDSEESIAVPTFPEYSTSISRISSSPSTGIPLGEVSSHKSEKRKTAKFRNSLEDSDDTGENVFSVSSSESREEETEKRFSIASTEEFCVTRRAKISITPYQLYDVDPVSQRFSFCFKISSETEIDYDDYCAVVEELKIDGMTNIQKNCVFVVPRWLYKNATDLCIFHDEWSAEVLEDDSDKAPPNDFISADAASQQFLLGDVPFSQKFFQAPRLGFGVGDVPSFSFQHFPSSHHLQHFPTFPIIPSSPTSPTFYNSSNFAGLQHPIIQHPNMPQHFQMNNNNNYSDYNSRSKNNFIGVVSARRARWEVGLTKEKAEEKRM